MLVIHENPVTDFNVIPSTGNASSLNETPFSNSGINTTITYTIFSTSLTSSTQGNVTSTWGPKRDPLYVVVPITVLYVVILLTGLVGNISTCIVIARNKHMHTATNYYLFSLAVSDLLLLVSGLPQEMYYNWSRYPYVFGEAFCILQGFAAETSANATVLTITAFTVERYVAICHPFQSHNLSKLSRAVRLILLIWIVAMGLAVPQALQFGVVYEQLPDGRVLDDEHTVCAVKRVVIPHSFEVSSLVFFVAPMTLISVLYALIGLQLRRSSLRRGGGSVRLKTGVGGSELGCSQQYSPQNQVEDGRKNFTKKAQIKATKHVVKMLVAVVVAFFICWAPFHAQRLLAVYAAGSPSPSMVIVYHALTYTSGVLYYLSTTVNPVLYHIMSHKFREAFKDTLARYLGRRRARGGRWQCYTVLSGRSSQHSNTSNLPSIASNCDNTTGSLRRYLEADMARLQGSRRPIVVSFRRHHTQIESTPVSIADTEGSAGSSSTGQEVYVSLEELRINSSRFNTRKLSKFKKTRNKLNETYLNVLLKRSKSNKGSGEKSENSEEKAQKLCRHSTPTTNTSFIYTPKVKQKDDTISVSWRNANENIISDNTGIKIPEENFKAHYEAHNTTNDDKQISKSHVTTKEYPKVEDIEIFQEQHLKIQSSFKKRRHTSRHNRRTKIHKPPNAYSSSIEYYFREPRGEPNNKNNPNHTRTNSENETQFCNVPRSSTLPSFQTPISDLEDNFNDRRIQVVDTSMQNLKNPNVFQNNFDSSLQDQLLGETGKGRLISQHSNDTSEGKNSKTSDDSDSLDSNGVSKSEPCMKDRISEIQLDSLNNFDRNPLEQSKNKLISINRFHHESFRGRGSKLNEKFQNEITSLSNSLVESEDSIQEIKHAVIPSGDEINNDLGEREKSSITSANDFFINRHGFNVDKPDVIAGENIKKNVDDTSIAEKNCIASLPKQTSIYDFSVSVPCCNSRPKSCTDLTLQTHLSKKQEYKVLSANVHPSVTICNLAL